MQPLIAKVKVGDVLKGTRNLRNYLRTVSLFHRVQYASSGLQQRLPKVYVPSRSDAFVVAVNAWGRFGVWCEREKLVLLWVNPSQISKTPAGSNIPLRISSETFAHWFVRTKDKTPDFIDWPRYAYNMWGYFHMNAYLGQRHISPFTLRGNLEAPFMLHKTFEELGDRAHVQALVKSSIQRGLTRAKVFNSTIANRKDPRGALPSIGPSLDEIASMRSFILTQLSDHRTKRKIVDAGLDLDLGPHF